MDATSSTQRANQRTSVNLMLMSGLLGLSLFLYANSEPTEGFWYGLLQMVVNLFVFVVWFKSYLRAVSLRMRLVTLIGSLVPVLMASITLGRVLL